MSSRRRRGDAPPVVNSAKAPPGDVSQDMDEEGREETAAALGLQELFMSASNLAQSGDTWTSSTRGGSSKSRKRKADTGAAGARGKSSANNPSQGGKRSSKGASEKPQEIALPSNKAPRKAPRQQSSHSGSAEQPAAKENSTNKKARKGAGGSALPAQDSRGLGKGSKPKAEHKPPMQPDRTALPGDGTTDGNEGSETESEGSCRGSSRQLLQKRPGVDVAVDVAAAAAAAPSEAPGPTEEPPDSAAAKKKTLQSRSRAQWEDLVRLAGGALGREEALHVVRATAEDMGYTELPKLSKDRVNKRSSQVETVSEYKCPRASKFNCKWRLRVKSNDAVTVVQTAGDHVHSSENDRSAKMKEHTKAKILELMAEELTPKEIAVRMAQEHCDPMPEVEMIRGFVARNKSKIVAAAKMEGPRPQLPAKIPQPLRRRSRLKAASGAAAAPCVIAQEVVDGQDDTAPCAQARDAAALSVQAREAAAPSVKIEEADAEEAAAPSAEAHDAAGVQEGGNAHQDAGAPPAEPREAGALSVKAEGNAEEAAAPSAEAHDSGAPSARDQEVGNAHEDAEAPSAGVQEERKAQDAAAPYADAAAPSILVEAQEAAGPPPEPRGVVALPSEPGDDITSSARVQEAAAPPADYEEPNKPQMTHPPNDKAPQLHPLQAQSLV